MEQIVFLQDLAIVMAVSAAIIILCHLVRLPVVLGYILAGFLIGPHTPPFPLIKDVHSIEVLSQLGIILLLFSIGLEFSFSKLMRVGLVAVFAATFEIFMMICIGFYMGRAFGWNMMDSVFLGAILSISSTTIIAKVLIETKKMQEEFAQVILGILIIEDVLAIVIIAILSGVASSGSVSFAESGIAFLKVSAFVSTVLVLGFLIIPRLLNRVERFKTPETITITVLGLCFGVSYAAETMGFSVALGAFLVGAIIAETRQAASVVEKMEPIRDMFTAIFFVSVGMLIQPALLVQYAVPILIVTVVTIAGKVISCSAGTFLTGYSSDTTLKVGLGLAQIGEFSFIIAQLGESTQVTSRFLYPIAVSVSAITTLTTPLLMSQSDTITRVLKKVVPKPLATFFGFYTAWFQRLGGFAVQNERAQVILKGLKRYLPWLFGYIFSGCAVLWMLFYVRSVHGLFPGSWIWIVSGFAALPFLIGAAHTLDRIVWDVGFLNLVRFRREIDASAEANIILHNAIRFLLVFFFGMVVLGAGSLYITALPFAFAVLGLMFVSGLLLWGSLRRLHERVEKIILGFFDYEEAGKAVQAQAAHDDLVRLIHEEYPWQVETEDFLVPYGKTGINRTIRELHLRSETGASIVAIYRESGSIPNPQPEIRILAGDVLLLMGDRDQIKAAVAFLHKKTQEKPFHAGPESGMGRLETRRFRLAGALRITGKRIRDLHLRSRTEVSILGIQKGGRTINNPGSDEILEEGDTLILFGTSAQLEAAQRYLKKASEV